MVLEVIDNPAFKQFKKASGFTNAEFKQLAGLYSRAATDKVLYDIGVNVDFDNNVCTFTYYRSNAYRPYLEFVIRRVGPQTDMYELYKEGHGRIAKSGLFARVFDRLDDEIASLTRP